MTNRQALGYLVVAAVIALIALPLRLADDQSVAGGGTVLLAVAFFTTLFALVALARNLLSD